jgi:CheY-like chemotaxis protein
VTGPRRGRDPRLVSRCRAELDVPATLWPSAAAERPAPGPPGAGAIIEAETEELSVRGLFLRTDHLLPVGAITEVRVTLPDGTYLALRVRVAHAIAPATALAVGRHPGLGFELVGPDTPSRVKLRAYLDALRTERTGPGLGAQGQIVVVEPGAPLRARLAFALETAGFRVLAVASAPEALQACATWRPDAIVASATLEGMTGIDLAYAMSEHATVSDVPLALVGDDGDLARLEAYRAGVRDLIPRPFLDEELVLRVQRLTAPVAAAGPGLRGNLVDIGLATLLSLLELERKSGVLMLARTAELARIFVSEGRLLKVESSLGTAAATRDRVLGLLDWRDGVFEFSPAAMSSRDEIGESITALLLEHARTRDEAARAVVPVLRSR